ncbi:MAG: aldo/keto reductase [Planctomycetes bacterium]|nr:aldo/keto reductase [Planctomycetota bacterium]
MSNPMNRRQFLERAGRAALAGAAVPAIHAAAANEPAATQPALEWRNRQPGMAYTKLGRTNFMTSRVAFGAGGLFENTGGDARLLELAVERGVNYIDTARGYGRSEAVIGQFAKQHRDKLFVVSKARDIGWPKMTIRKGEDAKCAALFSEQLDKSLSSLGFEPVDCYMIQGAEHDWIVTMDALYNVFEKARKAGKVRYFGLATHTNVGPVCELAAQTKRYDVVMLSIHPGNAADLAPAIGKMRQAGIGVVSMKTGGKVRGDDFKDTFGGFFAGHNLTPHQKAFAWLLLRAQVDAFNSHMPNREILEENLAVPTLPLGKAELDAMENDLYAAYRGVCRHCGQCNAVCPNGVRPGDLLRCHAYRVHYREDAWAATALTECGGRESAARCRACGACSSRCPAGIDLPTFVGSLRA